MACAVQVRNEAGEILAELTTVHDKYVLPDGSEMYVPTDVAWCMTCRAFVLVESLPSPEEQERIAREFHHRTHSDPVLECLLHEARQWGLPCPPAAPRPDACRAAGSGQSRCRMTRPRLTTPAAYPSKFMYIISPSSDQ